MVFIHFLWIFLVSHVPPVLAYTTVPLTVNIGTSASFGQVAANFIDFLTGIAIVVCGAIFLVGALFVVLSRGKDDQVQKGKDLMIGSLIGLAVIVAAYAIVGTTFHFLYSL
ncbi:hypothetical protein A2635_03765 [Candidatus Peribacteria bacterium RIFCSPHIGHO2_01_FULL_51_9]|nr:MAG: hypothetical protein A2635_03765 [Candidatus Peribacteria bacterium RIFCSPHIGHO2_01_FULL_51_9]